MPQDAADAAQQNGLPAAARLDGDEFARRLEASSGVLWTIAAAVLGDPSRAEDALQEACVIALNKLDQFDPRTSFAAWMGAIVRNVARNEARKGARRATTAVEPEILADLVPDAGRSVAADERSPVDDLGRLEPGQGEFDDALDQALGELRSVQRAALLLRTVRGLGYAEISAALGIPEGTAMSHVHRARQALRERLTALDPDLRSASPDTGVGGGA